MLPSRLELEAGSITKEWTTILYCGAVLIWEPDWSRNSPLYLPERTGGGDNTENKIPPTTTGDFLKPCATPWESRPPTAHSVYSSCRYHLTLWFIILIITWVRSQILIYYPTRNTTRHDPISNVRLKVWQDNLLLFLKLICRRLQNTGVWPSNLSVSAWATRQHPLTALHRNRCRDPRRQY